MRELALALGGLVAGLVLALIIAPALVNVVPLKRGLEIDYACTNLWAKAAVLDTEEERACGFNCVDIRDANVTVFIWERTPKKVVFVNNLDYAVRVHHIVNGAVYDYVDLLPGERVVFVTITENDYFIETRFKHREWFNVGTRVYYTVCKGE